MTEFDLEGVLSTAGVCTNGFPLTCISHTAGVKGKSQIDGNNETACWRAWTMCPAFLSSKYVQRARMVDPKPGNGNEPEEDSVSLTYSGRSLLFSHSKKRVW